MKRAAARSRSAAESVTPRGITVVDPGWATRIIDGGRHGTRSLGVSIGGAADRTSWMIGNALVGNPADAPALEIAIKGPTLRANVEIGGVLFGAPFEMASGRQSLRAGRTFQLSPGEELHIGGAARGMRAYFCIPGGFEAPAILGSRSALDVVQRGMLLTCASSRLTSRFLGPDCPLASGSWPGKLRIVPGAQADWFDLGAFCNHAYAVSPASNRMGLRLQGPPLPLTERELVSEPVCPGTVQVTKDGQCIVLGVDGQTIGGYPKIGQVIRADLDILGQLRPGESVRFELVDLPTAFALDRLRRERLAEWTTRLLVSLPAPSGSANRG